jgi:flagellum-specific ATP synthase
MRDIVGSEHQRAANWFMELLAAHRRTEDLINIGAYVAGTNPVVDEAIEQIDAFRGYLRQEVETGCGLKKSLELLEELYSSRKVGVQP